MFQEEEIARILDPLVASARKGPVKLSEQAAWHIRPGLTVTFDESDLRMIREAHAKILEVPKIRQNFAPQLIRREVEDLIIETLRAQPSLRPNELRNRLAKLKTELQAKFGAFEFLIPVEKMQLLKPFRVGNVRFITFDEHERRRWTRRITRIVAARKDSKEVKKQLIENWKGDLDDLKDAVLAVVQTNGTPAVAEEAAFSSVRTALAVLSLYRYPNDDFYGRHLGIKGELNPGDYRVVLRQQHGELGFWVLPARTGPMFDHELDGDRIKFMRANGFGLLHRALVRKKLTDYESRILVGIYWFAQAVTVSIRELTDQKKIYVPKEHKTENLQYFSVAERFLKLFIALESLLILYNREPIGQSLAQRTALIVGRNLEQRRAIAKRIKHLHEQRSTIVHRGTAFVSLADLNDLTWLVQRLIFRMIKWGRTYKLRGTDDLFSRLEAIILS